MQNIWMVILNSGEIISADQAKKIGIIDEVISIKLPKKKKGVIKMMMKKTKMIKVQEC